MALLDMAAQGNQLAGLLAQRRNQPIPIQQGPGPGAPNPASAAPMAPMPQRPQSRIQPMTPRPTPQAPRGPDPALLGAAQPPAGGGGGGGGGGILGALGGIVGGADDPRLSEEQNESAWKQGLKAAGIVGLGVLTGGLGPGAAALAGITVGRNEADKARNEALNISREQAILREQAGVQEILSGIDMMDPRSRLEGVGRLIQRGHAEAASEFLEQDEALGNREATEREDMIRDTILEDLDDAEGFGDPENVIGVANRLAVSGLTAEANSLQSTASLMQEIREYTGELHWEDHGDVKVAYDNNGNERMRVEQGMSPYEQHQAALGWAKHEAARAAGATEDYLQNLTTLRGDFESQASDYMEVAQLTKSALEAAEGGVSDRVLVMALAKLVDPGGRVTDADFRMFAEAGGTRQEVEQYFRNLMNSENRLPANVRAEALETVERLRRLAQENYQTNIVDRYRVSAARAGVNPNDFIYDPFNPQTPNYEPLGDGAVPGNINPGDRGGNPWITGGGG